MNRAVNCDSKLCMAGAIRTKEKCPKCGKPFQENQKGLFCRKCRTTPNRYHLYLYARGYGRVRIYSGPDGYPLDSWERANRLLAVIRMEMDQGNFDIKKYLSVHLKPLQFSNYAQAWAARRDRTARDRRFPERTSRRSRPTSGTISSHPLGIRTSVT